MEEIIKTYFCTICKNHDCKHCMNIIIEQKGNQSTYRCANFIKKEDVNTSPYIFDYKIKSNRIRKKD